MGTSTLDTEQAFISGMLVAGQPKQSRLLLRRMKHDFKAGIEVDS